jgi:hypothetical protein
MSAGKRAKPAPDINVEIRRLQKTHALLLSIQHSANYDVKFSVADALSVVVALVDESIAGLDQLELTLGKEGSHAKR